MRLWLLLSLGLHIFLLLWLRAWSPAIERPLSPAQNMVAIQFVERQGGQPQELAEASGTNVSATDATAVSLQDLLPRVWLRSGGKGKLSQQTKTSVNNSNENYDSYSETGAMGVMNSMGLEEYSPMTPYFEAVWKAIDNVAAYPQDFVRQRIAGIINVHLVLDERGVFTGEFLEVSGSDEMLKTYVMALLLQSLKKPIAKTKWLEKKQRIPVMLSFKFEVFTLHGEDVSYKGSHLKNALAFVRKEYVDPKLNVALNQLFTKYVPPIIPIPGGFYIDFIRAYKMIAGLGEPTEEEKRRKRLKLLKKRLQQTIKKSPQTAS